MDKLPELEAKLVRLDQKRENFFRRIQLCYDAGRSLEKDSENPVKLKNFRIRYSNFSKVCSDYNELVQEIVELKQEIDPDTPPSYSMLESFQDLTDYIEYFALEYLKSDIKVKSNDTSSNDSKPLIHMPKIELVKFNGEDMTLWPLFHENFKQLVHEKPEFSKAEKLQYLLGSLTGKALKTCSGVEAIPQNYNVVWKLLEDTYHDKRFLANLYLDRLFNFRNSSNVSNSNTLQSFLEKFDTNVTALKRLKLQNLEDYILTYLAISKLPRDVVSSFELVRSDNDLPSYEELTDFIRKQNKLIVKTDRPSVNNAVTNNFRNFKHIKTFVANQNTPNRNTCIACHKNFHLLKTGWRGFKSSDLNHDLNRDLNQLIFL